MWSNYNRRNGKRNTNNSYLWYKYQAIYYGNNFKINKINIVIDCENAGVLAEFYSKLLSWEWTHPHANGWSAITSSTGMVIAFQEVENYTTPTWPSQKDKQGQMLHLDFYVDNLDEAVEYTIRLGAKQANQQYFRTSRTMLDCI